MKIATKLLFLNTQLIFNIPIYGPYYIYNKKIINIIKKIYLFQNLRKNETRNDYKLQSRYVYKNKNLKLVESKLNNLAIKKLHMKREMAILVASDILSIIANSFFPGSGGIVYVGSNITTAIFHNSNASYIGEKPKNIARVALLSIIMETAKLALNYSFKMTLNKLS